MNRIKEAFDNVTADEALKNSTSEFVKKEVEKRRKKSFLSRFNRSVRYGVCAAVVCVCFIAGGVNIYSAYTTPVSYISVDVNPSVELSLNRFDKVIEAEGYNDDGKKIMAKVDLKGMIYTEAIDELTSNKSFSKYLDGDALLSVTVISDNADEIEAEIQKCRGYKKYDGVCQCAEAESRQAAHEENMSFGKYKAYMELSEYDEDVTAQECRHMSMHEIHSRIDELKNQEDLQNDTQNDGHHYGKHHGN